MIRLVEGEMFECVELVAVWGYEPLSPRAVTVGTDRDARRTRTTAGDPLCRESVAVAGKERRTRHTYKAQRGLNSL